MTSVDPRLGRPLGVVSRRLLLLAAMNGALAGLVVAIVGLVVWVLAWPMLGQGTFPGGGPGGWPGGGWGTTGWVAALAAFGVAISLRARFRVRSHHGGWLPDAARRVESAVPTSRNVILTAAELSEAHEPVKARVREAILDDAASLLARTSPRMVVPLVPRGLSVAVVTLLAGALLGVISMSAGQHADPGGFPSILSAGSTEPEGGGMTAGLDVVIRVVPPAYSGDSVQVFRNPERVEALRGSRLELAVRIHGSPRGRTTVADPDEQVVLETLEGRRELRMADSGDHLGELLVEGDGFLVLERRRPVSVASGGDSGMSRRLIGVGALADPPPTVRIQVPGQDLYLPDGDRVLELEMEATDDRALGELELLFTRVSGFGELFEFREGTVPLEITRNAPDRWTARARWDLADLELDRGDVVVYRAVARDRRPGAPPGESDTWTVEILGSDAAPSGGFAGEDELTRYGLSQQMVLVLTERVRAQRPTLSADRLVEEVSMLAAAQRRVRAEFVFMLGGELEDGHDHADASGQDPLGQTADATGSDPDHGHGPARADEPPVGAGSGAGFGGAEARTAQELHEEAHARADADAAEGRLAQAGRIELSRAIQAMSQAVNHLNALDLDAALVSEALALDYLQRAFSSSRYLLRALSEREELDPGRRLSGERASAVADRRPQVEGGPDRASAELREILGEVIFLASMSGTASASRTPAAPAIHARDPSVQEHPDPSGLAARLLAVDPTSETLQRLSAALSGPLSADPEPGVVRAVLLDVVTELSRYLRSRHAPHPGTPPTPGLRGLESAWAEALERFGAGPR